MITRLERLERDEFLRGVIDELKESNVRWPGLWTRLEDVMSENAALRAQLGEATNSELDWTSPASRA